MRSCALALGLLAATLLLFLAGSLLMGARETLEHTHTLARWARPWALVLQLGLIFLLWWRWASVIEWLQVRGSIGEAKKIALLRARHRIVAILLSIEVLLVMGFPLRFIHVG